MVWQLFISTFAQFICAFVSSSFSGLITDTKCTYRSDDYILDVLFDIDFRGCFPAFSKFDWILALDV
jgi:hypothetical protein